MTTHELTRRGTVLASSAVLSVALALAACSSSSDAPPASDASASDGAVFDGPTGDSATPDSATSDGGVPDGTVPDGGDSGPAGDAASTHDASPDGATFSCTAPPSDLAACAAASDCAIVGVGCGCGQQLEYGVATKYLAAQAACETAAASHCALGCANFPGHRAQDGRSDVDGGTIAVRCAPADGGALACQTFVQ
jgi:hypothetical protein